jgi:hypothetical protein
MPRPRRPRWVKPSSRRASRRRSPSSRTSSGRSRPCRGDSEGRRVVVQGRRIVVRDRRVVVRGRQAVVLGTHAPRTAASIPDGRPGSALACDPRTAPGVPSATLLEAAAGPRRRGQVRRRHHVPHPATPHLPPLVARDARRGRRPRRGGHARRPGSPQPADGQERPEDHDPARRHAHRRVRLAARQGHARGDRLPRGGERVHRGRHEGHRRAAGDALPEMLGRIKETDDAVPVRDGDYWYYTRTEEGKAYPIFCRQEGLARGPGRGVTSIRTRWPRASRSTRSAAST